MGCGCGGQKTSIPKVEAPKQEVPQVEETVVDPKDIVLMDRAMGRRPIVNIKAKPQQFGTQCPLVKRKK